LNIFFSAFSALSAVNPHEVEGKMNTEIKGPQDLEKEVIKTDLCALCGACLGLCPYFRAYRGKIVLTDNCNLARGRCYAFCPRTPTDLEALSRKTFGKPYSRDPLGEHRRVVMARSKDKAVLAKAQYGGLASALVAAALKNKRIDAAVLTKREKDLLSAGRIVATKAQTLACAGSNYIASPTLQAFNRGAERPYKRLAAVGTPCQVLALAKMRANPLESENHIEKLALVIGLFCTWALSCREMLAFLKSEFPVEKIGKMDIPPPPANVFRMKLPGGLQSVSLDEVRKFIRPACTVCLDMTSEFSDLSVGAMEGAPGWNTVIVRTEKGEELIEEARQEKRIQVREIPEADLSHLQEAARLKKKRALENIVMRTGKREDLLYLRGSDALLSLLSGE
jgi:coenzyme F420 hydrogenase subunit beta